MTCSKCGMKSKTDPCPECKRLLAGLRNAVAASHVHHRTEGASS